MTCSPDNKRLSSLKTFSLKNMKRNGKYIANPKAIALSKPSKVNASNAINQDIRNVNGNSIITTL